MTSKNKKRSVKDQMKKRTEDSYKNKDYGGAGGARVLDLSDHEKVEFFVPKKGKNIIDIIPYEVKSNNHPKGLKPGDLDYLLDYFVHYEVGPAKDRFVCLARTFGKPCPICEEIDALKDQGVDPDDIDRLKPKRRVLYNIIDLAEEDKGIQLFESSHFLFEKELLEEAGSDEEMIVFSDLEDGASIKFRASEKSFGKNTFMEFKSFSFEDRDEPYEDSIIDDAYSLDELLVIPSYNTVRDSFHGVDVSDEDEEEEEKPKSKKPDKSSTKRSKPKVDEEDDEPEDDEEEEEEKPKGKKSSKEKSAKGKCPAGHKFGKDCDDYDDCVECDCWDECSEA